MIMQASITYENEYFNLKYMYSFSYGLKDVGGGCDSGFLLLSLVELAALVRNPLVFQREGSLEVGIC